MIKYALLILTLGSCGRSLSITPLVEEPKAAPAPEAQRAAPPLVFPSVTLAWDANDPSENVTGYRIYHGQKTRDYNTVLEAGLATELHIPKLEYETVYYFAATAYNATGLESAFSDEVVYLSPGAQIDPPREPVITPLPDRIDISGGTPGVKYFLQSSTDLTTWHDVREITFDTEAHVVSHPVHRPTGRIFYRVRWERPAQ